MGQEFMPLDDDKQRFEDCLTARKGGSDDDWSLKLQPGALQVKLRDALGNHLNVELFYVQFKQLDEQKFFVGIREQADCTVPDLQRFTDRTRAVAPKNKN